MNPKYEKIKNLVKAADNKTLKEMYLELDKNLEDADTAALLVYTAVTDEMENRNLLVFDKETFQFTLIG